jgi:hypothetical protein
MLLHRFFKLIRIIKSYQIIQTYYKAAFTYLNLTTYIVLFVYLTHFAACALYYIGKLHLDNWSQVRYDNRTWISVFNEQPVYENIEDMPVME